MTSDKPSASERWWSNVDGFLRHTVTVGPTQLRYEVCCTSSNAREYGQGFYDERDLTILHVQATGDLPLQAAILETLGPDATREISDELRRHNPRDLAVLGKKLSKYGFEIALLVCRQMC